MGERTRWTTEGDIGRYPPDDRQNNHEKPYTATGHVPSPVPVGSAKMRARESDRVPRRDRIHTVMRYYHTTPHRTATHHTTPHHT